MPTVYFIPLQNTDPKSVIFDKITSLCKAVILDGTIGAKDFVAIKMHFGENKNDTHVQPYHVRPIIDYIKKCGGNPFLTDTNVLYRSRRSNAIEHQKLAEDHGFAIRKLGAPIIIGDGLLGNSEIEVSIPGQIYSKVSLAKDIMLANALVSVSHVTGHIETGLGATIKNLGMGISSRKGKLRQHSAMKPEVKSDSCTACGECIRWCPQDTIEMRGDVAFIKTGGCIGCGECLTVCRSNAIRYNWDVANEDLQKQIAEHALGAIINRRDKSVFFNFATSITKDCDCWDKKQETIIQDIGVLASVDPVALDKATLDALESRMAELKAGR